MTRCLEIDAFDMANTLLLLLTLVINDTKKKRLLYVHEMYTTSPYDCQKKRFSWKKAKLIFLVAGEISWGLGRLK